MPITTTPVVADLFPVAAVVVPTSKDAFPGTNATPENISRAESAKGKSPQARTARQAAKRAKLLENSVDSQPAQLEFDFSEPHTAAPTTQPDPILNSAVAAPVAPSSKPKIRTMKRIRFDREPESPAARQTPSTALPTRNTAEEATQPLSEASDEQSNRVSRPTPDLTQRIAEPVRIGATMVQLLKSYGITDEEIAAGVAAYAARTCSAVAS